MTKLSEKTIEERFGDNPIAMKLIAALRPLVTKFNDLDAQIEQIKREHDLKKKENDRDKFKDDEIKPLMAEFAEVTGEKTIYWPDGSKAAYTEPGKRRSYDWKRVDDIRARLQVIKGNLRKLADIKERNPETENPFAAENNAADIATLIGDIATGKEEKTRLTEVVSYLAVITAERDALKAQAETVGALKLAIDTDAQGIEICLEDLAAARSESDTSDRLSVSGVK
jgi:hypothetical protein